MNDSDNRLRSAQYVVDDTVLDHRYASCIPRPGLDPEDVASTQNHIKIS